MNATVSRNAPCPCGSGKRYKDCCGRLAAAPCEDPAGALLERALAAQLGRDLPTAETLYREALALAPQHPDGLHMLGVIRMERGDASEAVRLIRAALETTDWSDRNMQHNLGLALGKRLQERASAAPTVSRPSSPVRGAPCPNASISVVLPLYNHERYVAEAIASVIAQESPPAELIIIDDGSRDDSVARARRAIEGAPFPCRLVARENRGAAATLNEAIAMARGDFIQPLNSDDMLTPTRLARMRAAVCAEGAALGFADVECIDASGARIDEFDDSRVFTFRCMQSEVADYDSSGLAFLSQNPAISTGNLFFSRALFEAIGGFRDLRYHHDWDFVLRALWHTDPVPVDEVLYRYRFHESNTISEQGSARAIEADAMLREFLGEVFTRRATHALAPTLDNWGEALLTIIFAKGVASLVPRETMREFCQLLSDEATAASTAPGR
ncbi:MAG: glycosyltransferase [Burkholderiales bacterium]|nr:glycosyltransferase [Burkholderiales bacterium]